MTFFNLPLLRIRTNRSLVKRNSFLTAKEIRKYIFSKEKYNVSDSLLKIIWTKMEKNHIKKLKETSIWNLSEPIRNEKEANRIKSMRTRLASPTQIKKWSQRILPNKEIVGEVTNAKTVNYKTLKPEKGGLFCERIFGPVKDFSCACGKKKWKSDLTNVNSVCSICGVQFIPARSRRYKLGYIKLASPVTHVWYLRGSPSYISILLDLKKKKLESLAYCSETLSPNVKSFKENLTFENIRYLIKFPPFFLPQSFVSKLAFLAKPLLKKEHLNLNKKKREDLFLFSSNWIHFSFTNTVFLNQEKLENFKKRNVPFYLIEKSPMISSSVFLHFFAQETKSLIKFFLFRFSSEKLFLWKKKLWSPRAKMPLFFLGSSKLKYSTFVKTRNKKKGNLQLNQTFKKKIFANAQNLGIRKPQPFLLSKLNRKNWLAKYKKRPGKGFFFRLHRGEFLTTRFLRSRSLLTLNNISSKLAFNRLSLQTLSDFYFQKYLENFQTFFRRQIKSQASFFCHKVESKISEMQIVPFRFQLILRQKQNLINLRKTSNANICNYFLFSDLNASFNFQKKNLNKNAHLNHVLPVATKAFSYKEKVFYFKPAITILPYLSRPSEKVDLTNPFSPKASFYWLTKSTKNFQVLKKRADEWKNFFHVANCWIPSFLFWKTRTTKEKKQNILKFSSEIKRDTKGFCSLINYQSFLKTALVSDYQPDKIKDKYFSQYPRQIRGQDPNWWLSYTPSGRKRLADKINQLFYFNKKIWMNPSKQSSQLISPCFLNSLNDQEQPQTFLRPFRRFRNKLSYKKVFFVVSEQKRKLKNPLGTYKFRNYFSVKLFSSLKKSELMCQIKKFKKKSIAFSPGDKSFRRRGKNLLSQEDKLLKNSFLYLEKYFDFLFKANCSEVSVPSYAFVKTKDFLFQKKKIYDSKFFLKKDRINEHPFENLKEFLISPATKAFSYKEKVFSPFLISEELQIQPIKTMSELDCFQQKGTPNEQQLGFLLFPKESCWRSRDSKKLKEAISTPPFLNSFDTKQIKKNKLTKLSYQQKQFVFIKILQDFTKNEEPRRNNYYTLAHSCQWEDQRDWEGFLQFMTVKTHIKDCLIPSYLARGISLSTSLAGGKAIRDQLSIFNPRGICKKSMIKLLAQNLEGTIARWTKEIKNINYFLKVPGYFLNLEDEENQILFMRLVLLKSLRSKAMRRLKVVLAFYKRPNLYKRSRKLDGHQQTLSLAIRPAWMVLSVLPVLPPALRPILPLDSQQVAVSDLNKLYQTVLFRNKRVQRLSSDYYSLNFSEEMRYAQRLLQESVDALIENGKGDSAPTTASNNRPLKSLSDMLKGKKGRFRQNLLGKRVDYSGRSVIVVGPQLKLHECGLPQEMAMELFQPFLIRRLIQRQVTGNFISAKKLIKSNPNSILEILLEVMENRPILLNRAPTLHRLGIQAFQPKLVSGRAILLHPLVCPAFNADFDGDQMAVHVPLSLQACVEAWKLMGSRNNLLSPATGEPVIIPSQDMVLGCYFLTTLDRVKTKKRFLELKDHIFTKVKAFEKTKQISRREKTFSLQEKALVAGEQKLQSIPKSLEIQKTYLLRTNTRKNLSQKFPFASTLFAISNTLKSVDSFNNYYSNKRQVLQFLEQQKLHIHNSIWLRWPSYFELALKCEETLEIRVDKFGNTTYIGQNHQVYENSKFEKTTCYLKTTPGRVLMNQLIGETLYNPSFDLKSQNRPKLNTPVSFLSFTFVNSSKEPFWFNLSAWQQKKLKPIHKQKFFCQLLPFPMKLSFELACSFEFNYLFLILSFTQHYFEKLLISDNKNLL